MPELDVNGATLYYEAAGHISLPALLLVHAGIANLRMWDAQLPTLAREHYVIRLDSRGFGQTSTADVEYSNRADLLAILDHLGIAKATVIGCSRGGGIAIDFALDHPDRVSGLVTIGSGPSGFPEVELTERENELFAEMDETWENEDWALLARQEVRLWSIGPTRSEADLDPAFVGTAFALNADKPNHAHERATAIPLDPPAYSRLAEITVPTLVMVGDHDLSVAITQYEYLLGAIAGASGHLFQDAAHLPSVEKPEEFTNVLTAWLDASGL
jgi:3-oxoadipate enol-lactonase